MGTNISKQKREDLLNKIKEIRTFISTAPQDENTGNLLSYLSELEKDVNGKKYGLVFEEHREEIDEVLSTHTPVLTEDGSLFIDNGGQMNFLIEGNMEAFEKQRRFLRWQRNNPYYKKQFSVLGDSISTLDGYNPKGYKAFYENDNCVRSGVATPQNTWWGKVIEYFGGELLANNSWSGSRVTKLPEREQLFPSGCSDERTSALHIHDVKPDVILVYLGTNDWAFGAKTGNNTRILGEDSNELFCEAYDSMLKKMKSHYLRKNQQTTICMQLL